jgi:hypothetical protein
VAVLCALLLVALGPGLWLMRRQLQRYTPAAI